MVSELSIYEQAQVDELLTLAGIRRDANLDDTCGVFDDDGMLIATGSCFRNTLRCLAVSPAHQGEGLLNQVVTHLLQVQLERGNTHVFLCTKPQSAEKIADLGFYEIARTDDTVFLENRRNGFQSWLQTISNGPVGASTARPQAADDRPCGRDGAACIVMNANPFTLGHRYLVEQAAEEFGTVHVFVVQEEAGPVPFAVRKRLVREGLADLSSVVLHDGGPYIIRASTFPSYFLPDADAAIRAHAALDLTVFLRIADALGITSRFVGEEPTSRVTAIYNQIMAERLPAHGIGCRIVPRLEKNGVPVSASAVRQAIRDGDWTSAAALLPPTTLRYFQSPEAAPVIAAIRAMDEPKHY